MSSIRALGGIGDSTDLTFAYAYNEIEVAGQTPVDVNGVPFIPVSAGTVEDIENNYPQHRWTLSESTVYLDLELGFQATDNLRIALGGVNVTDEFIGEIGPPNSNRLSVGLQYPRRSAANYEGGSWYLKGIYSWQ